MHADAGELCDHIAWQRQDGDAVTVASNEDAARLNECIRDERIAQGLVDEEMTSAGSDGPEHRAG